MISIRLSDMEYWELKNRCANTGDVSVSEFVREATMQALGTQGLSTPPTHLEMRVASLFSRLEKLERKLAGRSTPGTDDSGASDLAHSDTA